MWVKTECDGGAAWAQKIAQRPALPSKRSLPVSRPLDASLSPRPPAPPPPQLLGARKKASAFAVLDANGVFDELRSLLAAAEAGRREWRAAAAASGGCGEPG